MTLLTSFGETVNDPVKTEQTKRAYIFVFVPGNVHDSMHTFLH
jgi:hypothetical protein